MEPGESAQQKQAAPGLSSELESFRQQWISEVRNRTPPSRQQQQGQARSSSTDRPFPPSNRSADATVKAHASNEDHEAYVYIPAFGDHPGDDAVQKQKEHRVLSPQDEDSLTAFEAYERATEREMVGNLGDSLRLYRKAIKLDPDVDNLYRRKHQAAQQATHQSAVINKSRKPKGDMADLLTSFAHLSIVPAEPIVEGEPQPPCPLATLPVEILMHVFQDVAAIDVGDFARLSMVCRRFAYLVATDQAVWRRVCEGSRFGFMAMHRRWQLPEPTDEQPAPAVLRALRAASGPDKADEEGRIKLIRTRKLVSLEYDGSWREMFRSRPRIRFNGCYITTVNYNRHGLAHDGHLTWSSPVHTVTYYRYLRFFHDGSAISLLTTHEPADVVHYLTREAFVVHGGGRYGKKRDAHRQTLPASAIEGALKGRWKLGGCSARDNLGSVGDQLLASDGGGEDGEDERRLVVETDGVAQKYMYRMELDMQSGGRSGRNNKLVWAGFYCYNRLTDDWARFEMRHDKPFFFSRVRSYGTGE